MAAVQTVALTGASGFVGGHVLGQLLAAGYQVRALVRRPSRFKPKEADAKLTVIEGGLFDGRALARLVEGADVIIHLVGIIMELPARGQTFGRIHVEGTQRVIDAAREANVKRCVHMSALGTRPNGASNYHRTKWQAECAVRDSGMACTIFRPSIIHGPDGEFMQLVKGFWCNRFPPFVPYFSAESGLTDWIAIKSALLWPLPSLAKRYDIGRYVSKASAGRLQPVWVGDVARCLVTALECEQTIGETYPMGGPDVFTWPQLFQACRRHFSAMRNKKIVAIPVWYAKMIAGMPGVPFNKGQVIMSQEDSICNVAKVQNDFGCELAPFEATLANYAAQIQ